MRKNLLLLLLFAISVVQTFAQQIVIEGTSPASNYLYSPIYSQNAAPRSNRTAYIYNESLLAGMIAGSVINELSFYRSNAGAALPAGSSLKLYLANTTNTEWPSGALTWNTSTATLVFDGDPAALVGTTAGYKAFPLMSNFVYEGNGLVLLSEYQQTTAPSTSITWRYNTPTGQPAYNANQVKYSTNNSTTYPTTLSTTTGNHPDMLIGYTPPPPCSSPIAGNASASATSTICSGDIVNFNLTGNSIGTGQTYKWQSFTTAGGPYTDVNSPSVSPKFSFSPTTTQYYRAAVTCGSTTVYSDSVLVQVANFFPAGTYTINSAQPTGGTNFISFGDAVNAIRCGITGPVVFNVVAGSGPYFDSVLIKRINNASSTNTITFNGNGAVINFEQSRATGQRSAILLDGADHVTINNLVIDVSTGTYGFGIQLINNADSNRIINNTINTSVTSTTNANHAGIIIGGTITSPTTAGNSGSYNTINNNIINGGYYGISLSGNSTAGAQSLNNAVTNNTVKDSYSYSIILSYQSGAVIGNNDISRPNRASSGTAAGVYMGTGDINTLVEKNRIHNMFDGMVSSTATFYGIYNSSDGTAASINRIENNLIYNNIFNGPFYGINITGADYANIYHNTITAIDATATTASTYGLFVANQVTGVNVYNNIFFINRSGTGLKRVFYFGAVTSAIKSNRNILYLNEKSAGSDNYVGQWGTSDVFATLAEWKTANNNAYDTLSLDLDPLFANAAAGNYTPTEPVIDNLGAPVGVTTDALGMTRNSVSPDAGAIEFSVPACTTPVGGNVTVSQSGLVCPNHGVVLSLAGNSLGSGQTYQWQSATSLAGPFTNMGPSSHYKAISINPTATMYYRAIVTCGAASDLSDTLTIPIADLFPGGTYTINSAVPTGGSNFQSFGDAVNAIRCGITSGVTFNVANTSGPYNEQVSIPFIVGASSTNPVVFNGNGRTIQYAANAEQRHVILLSGAKNIIIDSLRVVALDPTYGWGIHLVRNADSNIIRNSTIDMSAVTSTLVNNSVGISSTMYTTSYGSGLNASNSLITNNTIIGAHSGIVYFGKKNTISNNIIRDFAATGIMVTASDSVVIANNNISRANRTGTVGIFTGIELRAGTKNARINANRIHSTHNAAVAQNGAAYGIFSSINDAPTGQENVISNNLIYNFNSLSGTIYGLYNSTSDGVFYYHNTVVVNNPAATGGVTHGFSEQSNLGRTARGLAHGHLTLMNNLFYINRGGTGEKVALSFMTNPNSVTSNYNNLYLVSSETNNSIAKLGSTVYPTLAAWKAVNGGAYDQQSVSINPAFEDLATFNFRPTAIALDNLGFPVGITHDILGAPRHATTPDIGAIEFDASLPVTMLSFKGTKQGTINKLEWTTVNEVKNAGFELQRSAEGRDFVALGFVPSIAVNTISVNSYRFDDIAPLAGTNYYRLKQTDLDGNFTYSPVVSIKDDGAVKAFSVRAYPSPAVENLTVKITSPSAGKATMMVTDVAGKIYLQQVVNLNSGEMVLPVLVRSFAPGVYILKVVSTDGTSSPAFTFIKQ